MEEVGDTGEEGDDDEWDIDIGGTALGAGAGAGGKVNAGV